MAFSFVKLDGTIDMLEAALDDCKVHSYYTRKLGLTSFYPHEICNFKQLKHVFLDKVR